MPSKLVTLPVLTVGLPGEGGIIKTLDEYDGKSPHNNPRYITKIKVTVYSKAGLMFTFVAKNCSALD